MEHTDTEKRAEKLREEASKRAEKRDADRREREKIRAEKKRERELERQKRDEQRAEERRLRTEKREDKARERARVKAHYETFASRLLDILIEDNVVESRTSNVRVEYPDNKITINEVDVETKFGEKYPNLWNEFDIPKSEQSYIVITPKSYEMKSKSDDGRSDQHISYSKS